MQTTDLINLAVFHARSGNTNKLEAELLSLVEPTREEPGCLQYDICRSSKDPDELLVNERWRSQQDFELHVKTPYVESFMKKIPDLCTKNVEILSFSLLSPSGNTKI